MTAEATCAFERCQAGGVILEGAPRVRTNSAAQGQWKQWHPGCWAADQQEREAAR